MSRLGDASLGDKVQIRHENGTLIRGVLHEVTTLGINIELYAYRNSKHKRFFPWVKIDHIERDPEYMESIVDQGKEANNNSR